MIYKAPLFSSVLAVLQNVYPFFSNGVQLAARFILADGFFLFFSKMSLRH